MAGSANPSRMRGVGLFLRVLRALSEMLLGYGLSFAFQKRYQLINLLRAVRRYGNLPFVLSTFKKTRRNGVGLLSFILQSKKHYGQTLG